MNIQKLVRPNILKLVPYSSARSEFKETASLFIDANENPYSTFVYNRYPDPLQNNLKNKLAEIKKISPSKIFFGNGSDEAIDVLLRIFCEPQKDAIITLPPTYGIYKVYANIADVEVLEIPLNKDFSLPKEEILQKANASTKILFINNPNNPTGTLFKQKDILFLIKNFPGIVIVDEAYIDFSKSKSLLFYLKQFPNLIILQTFSKAFGLAGLRIGSAFANEEIIALMNKVKAPYNINSYTQKTALNALDKITTYQKVIKKIVDERELMKKTLSQFTFIIKIFPSEGNYLLVKMKNAELVYQYLLSKGIVVRNRSKDLYCENCLRISIGTPIENKKLISTLKKFSFKDLKKND